MKCISTDRHEQADMSVWQEAEDSFDIVVQDGIKKFLAMNSGGRPQKNMILIDGDEYEVRVFLSLNAENKYYYIKNPMINFLEKTKGTIIPIGIDSGDNYYCVNNKTGKVYFWSAEMDEYYCISENLEAFVDLFKQ